jgi:uncharacterized protein (TIGR00106 family)
MAIVEITIVPLGTGNPSVSSYVANIYKVLEEASEQVKYQMTPMSTIIEGELDDLFSLIKKMHEVPFDQGAQRVSTSIKIDDRRDIKASMEQKMKSVADKLKG